MEIQRLAVENAWRGDTTHKAICDIFPSANEQQKQHIYQRIRGLIGSMRNLGFFRLISEKTFQGKRSSKPLPQDLVTEILSRLSAEDVVKCIMVCKGWMDVTLTPHFFDLHQSRSAPVILLQNYGNTRDMKLYSLDLACEEPHIRRFDTTKLPLDFLYALVGAFDGLLLLRSRDHFSTRLSIYNPLTGRVVAGLTFEGDYCCGVWFHPFKREYLFLTASGYTHIYGVGYCYRIYNLKGDFTELGWYDALPSRDLPIRISHSLYSLLHYRIDRLTNCIMIFNIETETFDFKCHPHSHHCFRGHGELGNESEDMRLLEVEGSLAFAHVCSDEKSLYLWILADHATWHWIERCRIDLNWCHHRELNFALHSLCAQKGEMLMFYKPNRLIAFNLETRRVRKIDLNIFYVEGYQNFVLTTHRSSFVGLNRLGQI